MIDKSMFPVSGTHYSANGHRSQLASHKGIEGECTLVFLIAWIDTFNACYVIRLKCAGGGAERDLSWVHDCDGVLVRVCLIRVTKANRMSSFVKGHFPGVGVNTT